MCPNDSCHVTQHINREHLRSHASLPADVNSPLPQEIPAAKEN